MDSDVTVAEYSENVKHYVDTIKKAKYRACCLSTVKIAVSV